MTADLLGRFAEGFTSFRRTMANEPQEMRLKIFMNAANETASYVAKGLDRTVAADELFEIATSFGFDDRDAVQFIISQAFEKIEQHDQVPDDIDQLFPPFVKPNGRHPPSPRRATPYRLPDATKIPSRAWLFAGHYVRTVVTATVGPGGFGKTTLSLFEAVSMAADDRRVWYLSGEDQRDEIDRRIAAHCQHHNISPEQIGQRLFVDDKTSFPLFIGKSPRAASVAFDEAWLQNFEGAIAADAIDVIILDPFIGFHAVPENDNGAIDQIMKRLGLIALATNSCIEVNHHVRKLGYGQTELTVDDTRGGSAIVNAVRSSRVINRMSDREADLARISYDKRSTYLRLDKGKRNMAPAEKATWFHLVSVHLPNGDNVQALERWEFPEAFAGMSEADVIWVQTLLREKPRRASSQSDDWLGHYLGTRFGRDTSAKDGAIWANKIIGEWMRNNVFKKMPMRDPETRKPNVPFYVSNDFQESEPAEAVKFPVRERPERFRKISEQSLEGATCMHCQKSTGQIFRLKDATRPGSKSETLHEACAAGWFAGTAQTFFAETARDDP